MAFLDETGLAELWSLIQAEDADVTALANTKAKIETGSYTGNGNYQSGNPIILTFGFAPKIVFICKSNSGIHESGLFLPLALKTSNTQYGYAYMTNTSGFTVSDKNYAKFSDNTLTWYFNGTSAASQLNSSGITYHYIAIG